MRESVIEVLFYLFDDLLPGQEHTDLHEMAHWLSEAGFRHDEVDRAMQWFYELSQLVGSVAPQAESSEALRIFSAEERQWLDSDAQDYLHGLLRLGVLDNALLEKVVERLLALEERLDIGAVRWVTALVVLNVYNGNVPDSALMALQEEWLYPAENRILH